MWAVGHLCVWQTCMVYARGLGHRVKLWLYTCTRFVRFTHDPCTTGAEEGMVPDLCVDSVTVLIVGMFLGNSRRSEWFTSVVVGLWTNAWP